MSSSTRSDDPSMMSSDEDSQPVAKKQKTCDADGPVEDDESGRAKLKEAGFDPDDVHTARSGDSACTFGGAYANVTPMAYFASLGDLPMCRYLHHARDATTTAAAHEHRTSPGEEVLFSPMYAAVRRRQRKTVEWLFNNGAKADAFVYVDSNDISPPKSLLPRVIPSCLEGHTTRRCGTCAVAHPKWRH